MTTIIQIGNSDDKLTQREWSEFCEQVDVCIRCHAKSVHFYGHPPSDKPWQNAAWIFECDINDLGQLSLELPSIRKQFKQDSIAITNGSTHFI